MNAITVQALLRQATDMLLYQQGFTRHSDTQPAERALAPDVHDASEDERRRTARNEAEVLLCFVTGWTRLEMITNLSSHVPDDVLHRFHEVLGQRLSGKPLQHITEAAPFYGRLFQVRPGCLIPRPETEVLVESATHWIQRHVPEARVLDLGTGSGAIAITVALECPQSRVVAVDISKAALDIARENALVFGAHVDFILADGIQYLQSFADTEGTVDDPKIHVLVSNPPYIPTSEVETLDDEVRLHEPRIALDGGQDGLDYYRNIAKIGDGFFANGRCALFYEVGAGQAEDVIRLYQVEHQDLWPNWRFEVIPDLRGIGRVVFGERVT
jgi:release factor glutamine methyltransferase